MGTTVAVMDGGTVDEDPCNSHGKERIKTSLTFTRIAMTLGLKTLSIIRKSLVMMLKPGQSLRFGFGKIVYLQRRSLMKTISRLRM